MPASSGAAARRAERIPPENRVEKRVEKRTDNRVENQGFFSPRESTIPPTIGAMMAMIRFTLVLIPRRRWRGGGFVSGGEQFGAADLIAEGAEDVYAIGRVFG